MLESKLDASQIKAEIASLSQRGYSANRGYSMCSSSLLCLWEATEAAEHSDRVGRT